jgi:4-hydroxy-3-polyprenylbenzoate decarboxylase
MELAAQEGAIIAPPVPIFYNRPASLDEIIDQTVRRNLKRLGLEIPGGFEWGT